MKKSTYSLLITLAAMAGTAQAERIGHHGGPLLHCEPPSFFDETPARDSKAASFQDFSLTASDNTEAESVKVWVNNQPVDVSVTPERSGRLLIKGRLSAPITAGKAWVRATGDSKDGCDELFVWTVYLP
ncbi:hypothetical protein [Methylococcus sp. EFPC2]|uniref:hypothetical protein n=1 Tax=Methylococcus sp. EFPC2 TaxID=2812648 RepID=UPI0019687327|nr:hypothetical protein [Methylococcus sp. EFPC2]QSA97922.1 hypothetical protein JWZ97_03585 [Methylococcus sp. EFPC2]